MAANVYVFNAVIDACARAGQSDRAIQLLYAMEDKYMSHRM